MIKNSIKKSVPGILLTLFWLMLAITSALAQGKPFAQVKSAKGPYFATFNAEHTKLLATCFAESEVQIIDLKMNRPGARFYAGYEPVGIAVSPSGDKILVTNLSPGLVKVIGSENYEILDLQEL